MNEREKEYLRKLLENDPFESGKGEPARRQLLENFDQKKKRAHYITWAFLIPLTVVDAICAVLFVWVFFLTSNVKWLIAMATILILSNELSILMKLWYWVVNNKYAVLKEVKHLQIQVAELSGKIPETQNRPQQD